MSYEEELEQLQQEAMNELEGDNDGADADDNQQEESTGESDDNEETEDDRDDSEADEGENDNEDDDELEDEEDLSDDDDDTSDSEDSNTEESNDNFEPIEVEVGGQKISINNKNEMMAFIRKGANSMTQPTKRKSQNDQIIEQGKLSEDDLALLIDAKNGNKAAIAKLAKDSGVDIYDIEDDSAYTKQFNPKFMSEVDEVAEEILQDETWSKNVQDTIKKVPDDFTQEIMGNAAALRNFANHVRSGLADKIIPEAKKSQIINGGSFLQNYISSGQRIHDEDTKTKKEQSKRKVNPRAEKLKKRASNKKGSNKGTDTKESGDAIWNMSTADFNKKYM